MTSYNVFVKMSIFLLHFYSYGVKTLQSLKRDERFNPIHTPGKYGAQWANSAHVRLKIKLSSYSVIAI